MKRKKDEMVSMFVNSGDDSFRTYVPKGTIHMIGSAEDAIFVKAGCLKDIKYIDEELKKRVEKIQKVEKRDKILNKLRLKK